jgi:hypothetical protein
VPEPQLQQSKAFPKMPSAILVFSQAQQPFLAHTVKCSLCLVLLQSALNTTPPQGQRHFSPRSGTAQKPMKKNQKQDRPRMSHIAANACPSIAIEFWHASVNGRGHMQMIRISDMDIQLRLEGKPFTLFVNYEPP